jgi:hypothetical protein
MKKHLFGFAIFGFIFTSFAITFAYFYAPPIPQLEVTETPVFISQKGNSCRKKTKNLTYEIISSQLDAEQNKLFTRIKFKWNTKDEPPKRIFGFVELKKSNINEVYTYSVLVNAGFSNANETVVLIESDATENFANEIKDNNIYAKYYFSENDFDAKIEVGEDELTQSFPVVLVHKNKNKGDKIRPIIVEQK